MPRILLSAKEQIPSIFRLIARSVLVVLVAGSVACHDSTATGPTEAHLHPPGVSPDVVVGLPTTGSKFFVTIDLTTSCSASGTTIIVTDAQLLGIHSSTVLTTDACSSGGLTRVLGPYPAGSAVTFSCISGVTGLPCEEFAITNPTSGTINYEDGGGDEDFNDVVLTYAIIPAKNVPVCPKCRAPDNGRRG
jgi:hypothetical protein